jgi:hypothetical protein
VFSGAVASGAPVTEIIDYEEIRDVHAIAVGTTSGNVNVDVKGSIDNINWYWLVTGIQPGTLAIMSVANLPARYVQVEVSTTLSNGNATVTVAASHG